jgi:hypothetical protein
VNGGGLEQLVKSNATSEVRTSNIMYFINVQQWVCPISVRIIAESRLRRIPISLSGISSRCAAVDEGNATQA